MWFYFIFANAPVNQIVMKFAISSHETTLVRQDVLVVVHEKLDGEGITLHLFLCIPQNLLDHINKGVNGECIVIQETTVHN